MNSEAGTNRKLDSLGGDLPASTSGLDAARAYFEEGVRQFRAGALVPAEACFRGALAAAPPRASVLSNLAQVLLLLERVDEALRFAREAVDRDPKSADAWFALGRCLENTQGTDDEPSSAAALRCFDCAIDLRSHFSEAWVRRGAALCDLRRDEEALASFARALVLDPTQIEARTRRVIIFGRTNRREQALEEAQAAVACAPESAAAWLFRGIALDEMHRFEDGLPNYERALLLDPRSISAWLNRGATLCRLNRYGEAINCFESALLLNPGPKERGDAHWNLALACLVLAQFERGWIHFGQRWVRSGAEPRRYTERPLERMEQITAGCTVLLWAEQGYGDTLQFCRYARMVQRRGARVLLGVYRPALGLLRSLGGVEVFVLGDATPPYDFQAPLLDLPGLFQTTLDNVPLPEPYLQADVALEHWWGERLASRPGMRIGVSCSGNALHVNDQYRSMSLSALAPLCQFGQIYVIQKELRPEDARFLSLQPHMHFLGEQIRDFSDSAAIVQNMDLVISVDTSLVHLAGALGKAVWVLLAWAPDWRWLLNRTDTPWYPSARLFRQPTEGDWDAVVKQVTTELARARAIDEKQAS